MKRISNILIMTAISLFLCWSCGYDDDQVRKEIGLVEAELAEAQHKADSLNDQITALSSLAGSSFISYLGNDEKGNYVITYMNAGGEEKTLTLALGSDVTTLPVVSAGEFTDGKLYWRKTSDNGATYSWILNSAGQMMPVGGEKPEVSIDSEGFWTVNGVRVTDASGAGILASDVSNNLFSSVNYDETTGLVIFTLADGSSFSVKMYEALGITFSTPAITPIPDKSQPVKISYTVTGSMAADAVVDYFTAYNVEVSIDKFTKMITVTLDASAEEGNTVIMVSSGKNVVLKPLFFTAGTAQINQPVWDNAYGTGTEILLPGDMTEFSISVSHNIDYQMSISEDCASWLKISPTKAEMVTTKHNFIADYYENDLGADRKGTVTFTNKPYNVTVSVVVRQSPKIAVGPTVPGISTGADLVQFAKAVNAGASLKRWQNDQGEVVLLNDIDLTGLTEWTPIGSALATGQPSFNNLVNPFTGVFNGQGFTIKGIQWSFNAENADTQLHGFFGAIKDATIENLVLGSDADQISVTGTSANVVSVGAVAGYAETSVIKNVKNNVSVVLTGDNPAGTLMMLSGIAGCIKGTTIGGADKADAVINTGTVKTGKISNTANGGTGMNVAGICGFVLDGGSFIDHCTNYGSISSPTGRGGGIAGSMGGKTDETTFSKISNCTNAGLVQDDIIGQFEGSRDYYNYKRMGGILGGSTNTANIIEYCTNSGNVFSQIGCRAGGFAGHANLKITGCVNKGIILSNITYSDGAPQHGPGWACGYGAKGIVTQCVKGGKVGEWDTYKDNPSAAPDATNDNAFCYKNADYYDPSQNL